MVVYLMRAKIQYVFWIWIVGVFSVQAIYGAEVGSFVVMNAENGKVLLQKDAHVKQYPASTTKIATVAYVLHLSSVDLQQKIVVPPECVRTVSDEEKSAENFSKYPSYVLEAHGSSAGFKAGEIVTLEDVLYGILLSSGNDAANTLAYYWGNRSIEQFMEQVNQMAQSLGCLNTSFENPHGLHHPQHVSSAYDLALLASYGLKNPLFAKIVSSKSYVKAQTNKQPQVTFLQTNRLLLSGPQFCEYASGVKTGYHKRAQHCFVGSGENGDRKIVVVLLHCPDRKNMFSLAKKLLEAALSEKKVVKRVIDAGKISLTRSFEGQTAPISLEAASSYDFAYYPSESPKIHAEVVWNDVDFPVTKGQKMGTVHIFSDGKEVSAVEIVSHEDRQATFSQRILSLQKFLQNHKGIAIFVAVVFAGIIIAILVRSFGKKR